MSEGYNHQMARMRLLQPAFPIIILFLLALQVMGPSRVWTILLVGLGGVFVMAYLWAWDLGRNFQLRRENNLGWLQVGGRIEERLTLSNTSMFPAPWIQFIDQSTLPDFDASRSIGIRSQYFDQWTVSATCKQRGLFYFGDAKIQTGDPFGIFDVTIHAAQRTSILVLPQVATLPDLPIAASGASGNGRPRRNAIEQSIHASTVREYSYGDSTRLIHWPTTARTNKVFVRLMESAPEGNWWILLDLEARHMLGTGWDSIEEQGVTVAASLADKGLRAHRSVGLISNGTELTWLAPKKGDVQRWEIMRSLALAGPGRLGLGPLLQQIQPSLGKRQCLIVITASTELDWLKTLLPVMRRGIIPTIILLDPSTYGGSGSAENAAAALNQLNIACHVIPRGTIEAPKAPPQHRGQWNWYSSPTGETVPYALAGIKPLPKNLWE